MTKFEPRSFLLVLFAFVGNAQVMGLDLTLTFIAPLLLLAQLKDSWTIRQKLLPFLFVILALLSLAALRATIIGIPYFDAYYLWPLKAIILVVLVAFGRGAVWPVGNMLALTLLVVSLILVGTVENGRLVSVFGPNMLYRIFGMLFLFSLMYSLERHGVARLSIVLIAAFGLFAMSLTGSAGALVVILISATAFLFRLSKGIFVVLFFVIVAVLTSLPEYAVMPEANLPPFLDRTLYKIGTIETSSRLVGWAEILSRPFTLTGYPHSEFSGLWRLGYAYPHNIFVELYAFFGAIGLFLSVVIFAAILKAVPRLLEGDILSMTFVVLLVGSNVSGDLSDNYGVIGLAAGLMLRPRHRAPSVGPSRPTRAAT